MLGRPFALLSIFEKRPASLYMALLCHGKTSPIDWMIKCLMLSLKLRWTIALGREVHNKGIKVVGLNFAVFKNQG